MGNDSSAENQAFIEMLYESYLKDPSSVAPELRDVFEGWGQQGGTQDEAPDSAPFAADDLAAKQHMVDILIRNYRTFGHIVAQVNPLERADAIYPEELRAESYGFGPADYDVPFIRATTLPSKESLRTLRSVIGQLKNTYCRRIGVQYMHIEKLSERQWLQRRMECCENSISLGLDQQVRILSHLTDATLFEEFILRKFVGAKSFSLEGGETLIPLMDQILSKVAEQGMEEAVIGMAHRGRLNVLANICGKPPAAIFREFKDEDPESCIGGSDVKYHKGYSGNWVSAKGHRIHLSMCFNPSHLEYVNAVALGRVRSKQDTSPYRTRGERGIALLIHGDASFAGEGIVQETLQMADLQGYTTGGTVHIVVNNQIGFTTDPKDSRSTRYCTDIAKMLDAPIFHVNGEDPEAVAQVVNVAMEFRQHFKRDVFIDMYCFRKRGHNENDEPRYTQPLMYQQIDAHVGVLENYRQNLYRLGKITQSDAERITHARLEVLERNLSEATEDPHVRKSSLLKAAWSGLSGGRLSPDDNPDTGLPPETVAHYLKRLIALPENFTLNPKHERLWKHKQEMIDGKRPLDWAAGEALSLASLLAEGHRVRMTGQDAQRGTFSHRHAMLHDPVTGAEHMPLMHIEEDQAPVRIYNSLLSEAGVLGFEYGYSLDQPSALVIWEAQFGDFANCAQVMFDQFITSAERKWNRLSGLVMLLPHGYEGQGPEHSSARLERFLQLCAEDNIQVLQPTTPSQVYHMLRRQIKRKWRKPLVVMSPKSLLRHPQAISPLEEFYQGTFQPVLDDPMASPRKVNRILLCSGKVYYDLQDTVQQAKRQDIAVVRVEEIYPYPDGSLAELLKKYKNATEVLWVQDEPLNMGAWNFIHTRNPGIFGHLPLHGLGRRQSASPATGSGKAHKLEHQRLMTAALAPVDEVPGVGILLHVSSVAHLLPSAKKAPAKKATRKKTAAKKVVTKKAVTKKTVRTSTAKVAKKATKKPAKKVTRKVSSK